MITILSAVSATSLNKHSEAPRATVYAFMGENLNEATNHNLWEEVDDIPTNCGTGTDLPCHVETTTSIQSWLSGKTPIQIRDQANSLRN